VESTELTDPDPDPIDDAVEADRQSSRSAPLLNAERYAGDVLEAGDIDDGGRRDGRAA